MKKYNIRELKDWLAFEKDNHLFELKYHGVCFWQLLRFKIILHSIDNIDRAVPLHPDRNTHMLSFKRFSYLNGCFTTPCIGKRDASDIFLCAGDISRSIDGKQLNPYVDFYYAYFSDFSCHKHLGILLNSKCSRDCDSNGLVPQLLVDLGFIFRHIPVKATQEVRYLSSILRDQIGYEIDPDSLMRNVKSEVSVFKTFRWYYRRLLENRFRCIMMCTGHYNSWGFALVNVAKELGIPFIECQHGIIGPEHPAYQYSDMEDTGKLLPDYLFTYGDYWTDSCSMPRSCKCISIGSPYMDYARKLYDGLALREERTVVFYSSGAAIPRIPEVAIKFAEIAVQKGYRVFYKFHPNEILNWRTIYPRLAQCSNITFLDSKNSVYEYMARFTYHVGVMSTVLFEAIAFGKPVFVIADDKLKHVEFLLRSNCVTKINNEMELLERLQSPDVCDTADDLAMQFYRPDALSNANHALHEILDCHEQEQPLCAFKPRNAAESR